MKITLKDGSVKEYSEAKSVYDIAADISSGLARVACAGEVNGEIVDLRTVIDSDCELNIVTASDPEGLKVIRHTASHVLAQAVKRLFPDAKIAIGPAIEDGFYYDFEAEPFSREALEGVQPHQERRRQNRLPGGKGGDGLRRQLMAERPEGGGARCQHQQRRPVPPDMKGMFFHSRPPARVR